MRDYKIGDWVIFTNKEYSDWWEKENGVSLYGRLAKIVDIDKIVDINKIYEYEIEFKEGINSKWNEFGEGKSGHWLWCDKDEFKYAIDHLKFKKWIKG